MRSPTGAPRIVPATMPNVAAATAAEAVPGIQVIVRNMDRRHQLYQGHQS